MRVAVVPDSSSGAGHYVAVLLTSDTTGWTPGTVRARFTRRPNGGYDAQVLERNYARAYRRAEIYRP